MKTLLSSFFIIFAAFNTNAGSFSPDVPGNSKGIKWDTKSIDLGQIQRSHKAKVVFTFENTSNAPLNITAVEVPDLLTSDYTGNQVTPGGSGSVSLNLCIYGQNKVSKNCYVKFSNGFTDTLLVEWEVVNSDITWTATDINFASVKKDADCVATFEFTNTSNFPATVINVSWTDPISAEWDKEVVAPGQKGFVKVRYNSNQSGYFTKSGTVYFDNGENYQLTVRGSVFEVKEP